MLDEGRAPGQDVDFGNRRVGQQIPQNVGSDKSGSTGNDDPAIRQSKTS